MTVAAHTFDTSSYEEGRRQYDEAIQKRRSWLASDTGDPQAICRQAVQFSIWNACIILILGHSDEEALRYFRQALAFGLIGLGAPGSTKGLRAYDVLMEIGGEESRIIYQHERRPSREPRMNSIADYSSVLQMAACFGERAELEEVAQVPEARYRNPNVVAGEDFYGYLRAWKHLLVGDDVRAASEMVDALAAGPNAASRTDMEAFVALLGKDEQRFRACAEKTLRVHRKRYQKAPTDPEGIICFPVLMLCRFAIDRRWVVEAWPYVPLKLIPNHKGAIL
jgi:hypothetical protein